MSQLQSPDSTRSCIQRNSADGTQSVQGSRLITQVGLGSDLWPVIIDRVSNSSVKKNIYIYDKFTYPNT